MDCATARGLVWPPERPALAGDDVVHARAHVNRCEACRSYLAQDRALLDLYERARHRKAPLGVRERVYDAIARARWDSASPGAPADASRDDPTSGHRRWTFVWPLAGTTSLAAVAAIAVAVMLTDPSETPGPTDGPDMFVEDYLRRAVGEDHIETNDPAEVRRFLVRELGLALGPIHFAGLDLSRAEICLLEGRRGAMIVYKIDGAEVSHYLVPRRHAEPRSPAVSTRSGGAGVGTPVVTWATPDVEQALVGEVSEAQLIAIAEAGSAGP